MISHWRKNENINRNTVTESSELTCLEYGEFATFPHRPSLPGPSSPAGSRPPAGPPASLWLSLTAAAADSPPGRR